MGYTLVINEILIGVVRFTDQDTGDYLYAPSVTFMTDSGDMDIPMQTVYPDPRSAAIQTINDFSGVYADIDQVVDVYCCDTGDYLGTIDTDELPE